MYLKRGLIEKLICFVENAIRFVKVKFYKTFAKYFQMYLKYRFIEKAMCFIEKPMYFRQS